MRIFEYKIIDDGRDGNPDNEWELSQLAMYGWELISILPQPYGNNKWYFKRFICDCTINKNE